MIIVIYILLGTTTGIVAGMLGVGGGMVIVPGLAMVFNYYCGYTTEYMHLAAGTSLAIMIFTAFASMFTNHKQKRVVWPIFKRTVSWIIAGDIVGALIAGYLNAIVLSMLFGILLLSLAIKMMFNTFKLKHKQVEKEEITIRTSIIASIGTVIGLKSGLFGIGGGAISVPFLSNVGLSIKKATGTSSAFTLPISIIGSICYIYIGILHQTHIGDTIGYVHWPATLIIAPFTMFFAPIGCMLSNRMSPKLLHIIFIVLLLALSIKMLISGIIEL